MYDTDNWRRGVNIYSRKGTKVIFDNPNNGYDFDIKRAKEHLIIGNVYTVDHTNVHSFSTSVYLEEFPKISFNSCLFSDTSKTKTFQDLKDKFKELYWPDGEHVIEQDKWKDASDRFMKYLEESGWTHEEWMSVLSKIVLKDFEKELKEKKED